MNVFVKSEKTVNVWADTMPFFSAIQQRPITTGRLFICQIKVLCAINGYNIQCKNCLTIYSINLPQQLLNYVDKTHSQQIKIITTIS